jgi:hypothetical protein
MKKIYLVTVEEWGYDEYDSMVVIADNEQEAIEMCKSEDYNSTWGCDGFVKIQGEITAKEIDLNTNNSQVILQSFNAG